MTKQSYVYIMTNFSNTTLYTGVTNNLVRRVFEHKRRLIKGFTSRYILTKLVYYEVFDNIRIAIQREKQIKGGSRKDKEKLINRMNIKWQDLYDSIIY